MGAEFASVVEALESDLNTSLAIKRMDAIAGKIIAETDPSEKRRLQDELRKSMKIMGLDPDERKPKPITNDLRELVEFAIKIRQLLRQKKEFKRADEIREELEKSYGI